MKKEYKLWDKIYECKTLQNIIFYFVIMTEIIFLFFPNDRKRILETDDSWTMNIFRKIFTFLTFFLNEFSFFGFVPHSINIIFIFLDFFCIFLWFFLSINFVSFPFYLFISDLNWNCLRIQLLFSIHKKNAISACLCLQHTTLRCWCFTLLILYMIFDDQQITGRNCVRFDVFRQKKK